MINAGVLVAARRLSDSVARPGISCPGYAALLFLPSAAGQRAAWLSRGVRVADDGAVRGDQSPHVGVGGPVLEFRVLGPVQAVRDGRELALGGPRRRAVLALLLVA